MDKAKPIEAPGVTNGQGRHRPWPTALPPSRSLPVAIRDLQAADRC